MGVVGAIRSKKRVVSRRDFLGLVLSCQSKISLRMQRGALPRPRRLDLGCWPRAGRGACGWEGQERKDRSCWPGALQAGPWAGEFSGPALRPLGHLASPQYRCVLELLFRISISPLNCGGRWSSLIFLTPTPSPDCSPLWRSAPEQRGASFPDCVGSRQPSQPGLAPWWRALGAPCQAPHCPRRQPGRGFCF